MKYYIMSLKYLLITIFGFIVFASAQITPRSDLQNLKNPSRRNSKEPANDFYNNQNYFQDIFMEHSKPLELEFGHVFENPSKWEQRFEKNDIENKRFQGKVRWGNNEGNYGEHYWDLNHRK